VWDRASLGLPVQVVLLTHGAGSASHSVVFGRFGDAAVVYLAATARPIRDDELEVVCPEAFRTSAGARRFEPDELRADAPLRLYVAHATSCEVHVAGSHPVRGRAVDTRQPADPTWPEQRR